MAGVVNSGPQTSDTTLATRRRVDGEHPQEVRRCVMLPGLIPVWPALPHPGGLRVWQGRHLQSANPAFLHNVAARSGGTAVELELDVRPFAGADPVNAYDSSSLHCIGRHVEPESEPGLRHALD